MFCLIQKFDLGLLRNFITLYMNKLFFKFTAAILITLLCFSCTQKESDSRMIATTKELKYDKLVVKVNKDTILGNEIELDKELILNLYGLTGFNEIVGKIFIGCNLILTDETGKEIIYHKDLYSYYDVSGIEAADIKSKFSISLNLQTPIKKGGTYTWKSRIWDKKGSGEINTEYTFKIK